MTDDYVKTGEDDRYRYYRNDSEVYSSDENTENYSKLIRERNEFYVKFTGNNPEQENEIEIKKKTFHRIMILSECEPEEQVLFSLHKTIKQEKPKNPLDENEVKLRGVKKKLEKKNKNKNSEKNPESNENDNVLITNNTPTFNKEKKDNIKINIKNENEDDFAFAKSDELANINVSNSSKLIEVVKYFYLILSACGGGAIGYCIYAFINEEIIKNYYLFLLLGMGIILIITGVFGIIKIIDKVYDNMILFAFTVVCGAFGLLCLVLGRLQNDESIKGNWVVTIVLNALIILFSVICIVLTNKLKNDEISGNQKKLEKLINEEDEKVKN